MNKTSNKFKIFYYIWGILLAVLLGVYIFMDMDSSVLAVTLLVLFGGAAIFQPGD